MKLRDLITGIIGLIFIAPVFFTSCEEDGGGDVSTRDTIVSIDTIHSSDTIFGVDTIYSSDTVYLAEENVFKLQFSHSAEPDDDEIGVFFAMNMNNISEVPTVEVNGKKVKDFSLSYNGLLSGQLDIPYGKSIQYSVSKGDSSTEGNFIMPEITEGVVNDSSMLADYSLAIPEAATFNASWQFVDHDFVRIEKRDDHPWMDEQIFFIESSSYSLTIDTTDVSINYNDNYEAELRHLRFYAKTGIGPLYSEMEFIPNVTGEYGNGYISAYESHYPSIVEMDPSLKSAQRESKQPPKEGLNKEDRIEKFMEDYKQIIKNSY